MSENEIIRLKITGMSCNSCVNNVERALSSVPGVKTAKVDLKSGEAIIQTETGGADTDYFIKAVEKAGFGATAL